MAYSNSKLISGTFLSPNRYNSRNAIIGITPHCYVGKATMASAGEWFGKPSTGASCNYYIDPEGRIALIVPESKGAWTSSSYSNDMNHITIECASETTDPYVFPAKTYESLVKLTADIYKRNGIKKATWNPNGNSASQITVHRWFKNKACPGNWLMSKLNSGEFCNDVNAILNPKPAVEVPSQKDSPALNNAGIKYTAHCQTIGWCAERRDGQVAGTVGFSKRLEALKIDASAFPNLEMDVKVHIQRDGWKTFKNIKPDTVIGTVGESKRIEAIEIDAIGVPAGKKLKYQVHVQGVGWTGWVEAGYTTGTVGLSKRIEAIQIVIE